MAFLFAFAVVLDRFLAWSGRIDSDLLRGLLRGSFIGIMLMGPILVGSTLMTDEAVASDAGGQPLDGCEVRDVAGYLETDPHFPSPQTVPSFMYIGPDLLYRTLHRVLAPPFPPHRHLLFPPPPLLSPPLPSPPLPLPP